MYSCTVQFCTYAEARLALEREELYSAVVYTGLKGTVAGLKLKCTAIQLIKAKCLHHIGSVNSKLGQAKCLY